MSKHAFPGLGAAARPRTRCTPFALAALALVAPTIACQNVGGEADPHAPAPPDDKINFGNDDRREPVNTSHAEQVQAEGIVLVAGPGDFTDLGNGTSQLRTVPFVDANDGSRPLCADERFRGQPRVGSCSGFLVGPNLIATAHHCVGFLPVGSNPNQRYVFHWRMDGANARTVISNTDIYASEAIEFVGGHDVAVVRLDRPAQNRRIWPLRRGGSPTLGRASHMIGHPLGLPQKYVNNFVVKDNQHPTGLSYNLDFKAGNSGSPIFDAAAGIVDGVLTNGPNAEYFVRDSLQGCWRSNVCSDSQGCPGFAFTNRASVFAPNIPGQSATYFVDVTGPPCVGCAGRADMIAPKWNAVHVSTAFDGAGGFSASADWTGIGFLGTGGTFFADVTGDGRADAIVSNFGGITVRRSTGSGFSGNEAWTSGVFAGDLGLFFADVTMDGRADAIAVSRSGVTVRRSTGSSFAGNETWISGPYLGKYGNYFADVTGDGRADAIVVNDAGVTIRRSNGSSFQPNETWIAGPYLGRHGNYFADVTGDGRADAIVVNDAGTTVRRSDGARFTPNETWTEIGFLGGRGQAFADVNGDRKADAIVINDDAITVRIADAGATRFLPNATWKSPGDFGNIGVFASSQR